MNLPKNEVIDYSSDLTDLQVFGGLEEFITVQHPHEIVEKAERLLSSIGASVSGNEAMHQNGDSLNHRQFEREENK